MKATELLERVERWLPCLTVLVAAVFAVRRLDDFDTWWHLAAGRWIVEHGSVPVTDTLSHTVPDHAWTNLQWLYDVALYLVYSVGGANLLVLFAAACFTLSIWLMMRNASLFVGPVTTSILGLFAIVIVQERFLIRPEMFSFVLLEIVLWILLTARRDEGRRLWLLVPAMLAWVNCHALYIIGLFAIASAVVGTLAAELPFLPRAWRDAASLGAATRRRLVVAAVASTAALLVNPYFLRGALFPFELLSRIDGSNTAFRAIGEFRRPFSGYFTTLSIGAYQVFFFASIALVAAAVAAQLVRRPPRRSSAEHAPDLGLGLVLFFAGLAYLSLLARRNMGVFVMGATPVVAAALAWLAPSGRGATAAARKLELALAPAVVAVCMTVAGFVASNGYYRWNNETHAFGLGVYEENFPIRAAEFAREQALPGSLYNDLTAGGYLTWRPPVDGGVFIDGRLEVYDTEFFSAYLGALSNPPAWQEQVDRYDVGTVFLFHRWGNRHFLIRTLARDPRWALVYHDEVAVVFVRVAGNAHAIAEAREAFPSWSEKTQSLLAAPTSSWRVPVERTTALQSYAALLFTIGEAEAGMREYERLLALGVPADIEGLVRFRMGYYLASKGDLNAARLHLVRAAELRPEDNRVRELIARIDAVGG